MNHPVFCNECQRHMAIALPGDPGQYTDSLIDCPCGDRSVVPRIVAGEWVLVAICDLAIAPSVEQKIESKIKATSAMWFFGKRIRAIESELGEIQQGIEDLNGQITDILLRLDALDNFVEIPSGVATIDRRNEYIGETSYVEVRLPCGYEAKFWLTGLSNVEYVRRTQEMKERGE